MDLPGYVKEFLQTNYYLSDEELSLPFDKMKPHVRDLISSTCMNLNEKGELEPKTEEAILEAAQEQFRSDIDSGIPPSSQETVDNFVKNHSVLNNLINLAEKQDKQPNDFNRLANLMAAKRICSEEYADTPKTPSNFLKIRDEIATELEIKYYTTRYFDAHAKESTNPDTFQKQSIEDIAAIAQMVQTKQSDKIAARFGLPDTQEDRSNAKGATLSFAMAEVKTFADNVSKQIKDSPFVQKANELHNQFQEKYPKTYVAAKIITSGAAAMTLGPVYSAYRAATGINAMRKDYAQYKKEHPEEKGNLWNFIRSPKGRQQLMTTGQNVIRMIPGMRSVGIALSAIKNSDTLRNCIKDGKEKGLNKQTMLRIGGAAVGLLAVSVTAAYANDEVADMVNDYISDTFGNVGDAIDNVVDNASSLPSQTEDLTSTLADTANLSDLADQNTALNDVMPQAEIETPTVEMPAPQAEVETPTVETPAPQAEVETPTVETPAPQAEVETPTVETQFASRNYYKIGNDTMLIESPDGSNTVVFGRDGSSQLTYRFEETENGGLRMSVQGNLSVVSLNKQDHELYNDLVKQAQEAGSRSPYLAAQSALRDIKIAEAVKAEYLDNPTPELEAQYNLLSHSAARQGVTLSDISENTENLERTLIQTEQVEIPAPQAEVETPTVETPAPQAEVEKPTVETPAPQAEVEKPAVERPAAKMPRPSFEQSAPDQDISFYADSDEQRITISDSNRTIKHVETEYRSKTSITYEDRGITFEEKGGERYVSGYIDEIDLGNGESIKDIEFDAEDKEFEAVYQHANGNTTEVSIDEDEREVSFISKDRDKGITFTDKDGERYVSGYVDEIDLGNGKAIKDLEFDTEDKEFEAVYQHANGNTTEVSIDEDKSEVSFISKDRDKGISFEEKGGEHYVSGYVDEVDLGNGKAIKDLEFDTEKKEFDAVYQHANGNTTEVSIEDEKREVSFISKDRDKGITFENDDGERNVSGYVDKIDLGNGRAINDFEFDTDGHEIGAEFQHANGSTTEIYRDDDEKEISFTSKDKDKGITFENDGGERSVSGYVDKIDLGNGRAINDFEFDTAYKEIGAEFQHANGSTTEIFRDEDESEITLTSKDRDKSISFENDDGEKSVSGYVNKIDLGNGRAINDFEFDTDGHEIGAEFQHANGSTTEVYRDDDEREISFTSKDRDKGITFENDSGERRVSGYVDEIDLGNGRAINDFEFDSKDHEIGAEFQHANGSTTEVYRDDDESEITLTSKDRDKGITFENDDGEKSVSGYVDKIDLGNGKAINDIEFDTDGHEIGAEFQHANGNTTEVYRDDDESEITLTSKDRDKGITFENERGERNVSGYIDEIDLGNGESINDFEFDTDGNKIGAEIQHANGSTTEIDKGRFDTTISHEKQNGTSYSAELDSDGNLEEVTIRNEADPSKGGLTATYTSVDVEDHEIETEITNNKTGATTTISKNNGGFEIMRKGADKSRFSLSIDKSGEITVKGNTGKSMNISRLVNGIFGR